MRIGMLTDNYETHVSGVTNHISLSKQWLENAGHKVYVFTFGKKGEVDEAGSIIYTAGIPITDFYLNFQYNQEAKELLSTMDIVHVHHPFISGILAKRYCTSQNIPIVFTNHTRYDLYTKAYLPLLPNTIGESLLKAFLSRFYSACDLVIIPSASMRQVMVDHFGLNSPAIVVPNGVDLIPFSGDIQPIDRQILGFTSDDVIIIYVGRLAPEKNLPFLLHAFHDVAISNSHARLLVVGDGPERKDLVAQVRRLDISAKVNFTGLVPYNDVPRYLTASDIFATPSLSEVFPLSTIEAIGAGLPVVGIDAPGTRDIIEDGINGLISTNDLSVFTDKLLHLTIDNTLRGHLGRQAVDTSKKYDIRITTDILLQHYERLIEESKHRISVTV